MPGMHKTRHLLAGAIAAGGLLGSVAGCGSSEPGYCSDVSDFETAVTDLTKVKPVQEGTSGVKAAVQKVADTGKAVVESAKSDFPDQTKALDQTLSTLGTTVKQLGDPATAKQAAVQVPGQASAVKSAADDFKSATDSKCD
jgi:hypothetical protein